MPGGVCVSLSKHSMLALSTHPSGMCVNVQLCSSMFTHFHQVSSSVAEQRKDPAIEELPLGQVRFWPRRPSHFHEVVHRERPLPCPEWCDMVRPCDRLFCCFHQCQDGLQRNHCHISFSACALSVLRGYNVATLKSSKGVNRSVLPGKSNNPRPAAWYRQAHRKQDQCSSMLIP